MESRLFCSSILLALFFSFSNKAIGQHASLRICDSLNKQSDAYFAKGEYRKMLETTEAAVKTCKGCQPEHPEKYITALSTHSVSLDMLDQLDEALAAIQAAHELILPIKDEHLSLYASVLNNMGSVYQSLIKFDKALDCFAKSLEIEKNLGRQDSISYAHTLWNMGDLYPRMGFDEKALKCYLEANQIVHKLLDSTDDRYAISFHKLAIFYYNCDLHELALQHALEATRLRKKNLGDDNPDYASSMSLLGLAYEGLFQPDSALYYFLKSAEILKRHVGDHHTEYLLRMKWAANAAKTLKKYDQAFAYYLEVLKKTEEAFGANHLYYARILNDFGSYYLQRGELKTVDSLSFLSLNIKEQFYGKDNDEYEKSAHNYAIVKDKRGDFPAAFQYYQESSTLLHHKIERNFGVLNEQEMEVFLNHTLLKKFETINYFVSKACRQVPESVAMIYDNALALKGLLLQNNQSLHASIRDSNDPALTANFDHWLDLRKTLAGQSQLPLAQRRNMDSLTNVAGELERSLLSRSEAFNTRRPQVNWKQVQANLQLDEAAIEFIHFRHLETRNRDSVLYAALVIRPSYAYPQLVVLTDRKNLERHLDTAVFPTQRYVNQIYSPKLFRLIWQPLDSLLTGVKKVYYAPSGLLYRIAFPAIMRDDSARLADKYQLEYMSSTRNLVLQKRRRLTAWQNAVLFGDIAYNSPAADDCLERPSGSAGADTSTVDSNRDAFADWSKEKNRGWAYIEDSTRSVRFDSLPFTKPETARIGKILNDHGVEVALSTGCGASEECVKSLEIPGPSPSVVHIATHGYWFSEKSSIKLDSSHSELRKRELFHQAANPLIRTGLALAGANLAWEKGISDPSREDGILTAYEISNMNLSNTNLVVLSACQTALGEIRGGEGVFGLQRAFKMAGADYLLLTLWNIRDGNETVEFVTTFYEKCLTGKPVKQAFYETQETMRTKHPDPYFWAGFVLVD